MTTPVKIARAAMWLILGSVAVAAAIVSFTALRDLGTKTAFGDGAPLLPVVIDAGAAVGSLVWLGRWAQEPARRFARILALTLLAASVVGNALSHWMTAEGITPHWTVVVAVSAVAPAVLGAVVHLAVLATDRDAGRDVAHVPAETSLAVLPDALQDVPSVVAETSEDVLTDRPDSSPQPSQEPSGGTSRASSPRRPLSPSREERQRVSALRKWIVDQDGQKPTPYAVRKRFRCSQTTAERLLELAAEDPRLVAVS